MITKFLIWDNLLFEEYFFYRDTTPLRVLACLLLSIFFIPADILLFPLELLALVIYVIILAKPDKLDKEE